MSDTNKDDFMAGLMYATNVQRTYRDVIDNPEYLASLSQEEKAKIFLGIVADPVNIERMQKEKPATKEYLAIYDSLKDSIEYTMEFKQGLRKAMNRKSVIKKQQTEWQNLNVMERIDLCHTDINRYFKAYDPDDILTHDKNVPKIYFRAAETQKHSSVVYNAKNNATLYFYTAKSYAGEPSQSELEDFDKLYPDRFGTCYGENDTFKIPALATADKTMTAARDQFCHEAIHRIGGLSAENAKEVRGQFDFSPQDFLLAKASRDAARQKNSNTIENKQSPEKRLIDELESEVAPLSLKEQVRRYITLDVPPEDAEQYLKKIAKHSKSIMPFYNNFANYMLANEEIQMGPLYNIYESDEERDPNQPAPTTVKEALRLARSEMLAELLLSRTPQDSRYPCIYDIDKTPEHEKELLFNLTKGKEIPKGFYHICATKFIFNLMDDDLQSHYPNRVKDIDLVESNIHLHREPASNIAEYMAGNVEMQKIYQNHLGIQIALSKGRDGVSDFSDLNPDAVADYYTRVSDGLIENGIDALEDLRAEMREDFRQAEERQKLENKGKLPPKKDPPPHFNYN